MSLHRTAARRDDNEQAIVAALRAVGATVIFSPRPDLIVGFRGVTTLLGVKKPDGPRGGKSKGRNRKSGDFKPEDWCGGPWEIVTTPAEALEAIGLRVVDRRIPAWLEPTTHPTADVIHPDEGKQGG